MKKTPIFILSAVLLFSCKKDSEETCATNTASVSGSYKVTAVTYKENASAPEIDYYTVWYTETCERDDIITFNSNGTLVAIKSSSTVNGTWNSGNDDSENKLYLDFGATTPFNKLNDDWHLIEKTTTKIRLEDISGGIGGTDLLTFEKN